MRYKTVLLHQRSNCRVVAWRDPGSGKRLTVWHHWKLKSASMLCWPCVKCSLLVVDVSESWLEVAANNSRRSRHNVNYIPADLAQDVNRQWSEHAASTWEIPFLRNRLVFYLNLNKWLSLPNDFWRTQHMWRTYWN